MLPTENPWPAIIVLCCVAIICLMQWATKRKSLPFILGIACLVLGVGCFVLDLLVETPSEQIIRNVYDLTSAFQKQDAQKTLGYFSPLAKERTFVEFALGRVKVGDDLRVSDVSVAFKAVNSVAISHFRANASISVSLPPFSGDFGYHPSRWELEWEREGGEWKIVKVRRLNPITGKEIAFMAGD